VQDLRICLAKFAASPAKRALLSLLKAHQETVSLGSRFRTVSERVTFHFAVRKTSIRAWNETRRCLTKHFINENYPEQHRKRASLWVVPWSCFAALVRAGVCLNRTWLTNMLCLCFHDLVRTVAATHHG
jgi:hypothetical protein